MAVHRFGPFSLAITLPILILAAGWIWLPDATRAGINTERLVCKTDGGNFATIQSAIDAAQAGDIIKVAAGVYTETKVIFSFAYNLYINKNIQLLGGYDCINWNTPDPAVNITTIRPASGEISVVTIAGQFGQSAQLTPVVEGFTISGGGGGNHGGGIRIVDSNAIISNNIITGNVGYLLGGGIWVQRGAPRIENNRIENNRVTPSGSVAGGGIELEGTQAVVVGNIIAGNVLSSTTGYGGGIAVDGGGPVTLANNTILNNTAAGLAGGNTDSGYGGGVSVRYSPVAMIDNIIQRNTANSIGRGMGGGVYIFNSTSFTLTSNTVMSNTGGFATGTGSYLVGGGILVEGSRGLLSGNLLAGNRANRNTIFGNGGGLGSIGSSIRVQGGRISNNFVSRNCEGYGGGVYLYNSSLTLDATRIEENCAANTPFYGKGGGLAAINSPYTVTNALIVGNYAFGNDTAVGGLFAAANSPGRLVNNTIANNRGQGIRSASTLLFFNNLVMGHTTGISLTAAVPVSVTFNAFYNNTTQVRGLSLGVTNIVINPQLDADYHLLPGSALVDAGKRANAALLDMDGEPRVMAGSSGFYRFDIGADELTGAAQRVVDLDVTSADLTIVGPGNSVVNPNSNGPNDWIGYAVMAGDINADGRVDLVTAAEDLAEDFNNPPFSTGQIFSLFNDGTRQLGRVDWLDHPADLTVRSLYTLQHIGSALASGDLNHDGRDDLIFGSYQDDGAGGGLVTPTVFALWGDASLAGTRILTDTSPADFMLQAPGQDFFAFSAKNALTAEDLNADGIDDLIVGDELANDGGLAGSGAVFVIFGGNGLSGEIKLGQTPADFSLYGPAAAAGLGALAVGKLDADSSPDLVARTSSDAFIILGPVSSTALHLSVTSADIRITGLQTGGVAVLDLNDDGSQDLILGSGSRLYVFPGPFVDGQVLNAASSAAITFNGLSAETFAVADVSGDAAPELILGVPSVRQALVIPGGFDRTGTISILDVAEMVVLGSAQALGKDVAAGDVDGDGRADLIVGSFGVAVPEHPADFQDAGEVYVFYGETSSGHSLYLPLLSR